jgi:hypothetical protein
MGEYANSKQDILDVTEEIKKGLGDVRSLVFLITYICGLHVFQTDADAGMSYCSPLDFPISYRDMQYLNTRVRK